MTSPTTTTEFRTPSADELDRYRRDGYLVVRGLVPSEVLDAAERGMERFYAGDTDRPFPGSTRYDHYDWSPADGPGLRKNDYTSRMVDELAGLVGWPGIGAFAAGLSGSQGIRLWHDQLLFKPPSAGGGVAAVGWHTDRQYWQTCSTAEMLTCWVPFHDCDAAVGGVSFIEGSHRWPPMEGLDFFDPSLEEQEKLFASSGQEVRTVVPTLARGDVTFHHSRTVHGSGPNLTSAPRRSMAVHLQPSENRWAEGRDASGAPAYHRNDDLVQTVDGHPDYTDPRICPVLWPVDGEG